MTPSTAFGEKRPRGFGRCAFWVAVLIAAVVVLYRASPSFVLRARGERPDPRISADDRRYRATVPEWTLDWLDASTSQRRAIRDALASLRRDQSAWEAQRQELVHDFAAAIANGPLDPATEAAYRAKVVTLASGVADRSLATAGALTGTLTPAQRRKLSRMLAERR